MPIRSDTLDSWDDEDDEFGNEMDLDQSKFWSDFMYDWDGEDPLREYNDQSPEWD